MNVYIVRLLYAILLLTVVIMNSNGQVLYTDALFSSPISPIEVPDSDRVSISVLRTEPKPTKLREEKSTQSPWDFGGLYFDLLRWSK